MINKYLLPWAIPEVSKDIKAIVSKKRWPEWENNSTEYSMSFLEKKDILIEDSSKKVTDLTKKNKEKDITIEIKNKELTYAYALYNISKCESLDALRESMGILKNYWANIKMRLVEPKKWADSFFYDIPNILWFDNNISFYLPDDDIELSSLKSLYPPLNSDQKWIHTIMNSEWDNCSYISSNQNLNQIEWKELENINRDFFKQVQAISYNTFNAKTRQLSSMTGQLNKKWLDDYSNKVFDIAEENNFPLTSFMIDINNFKKYNTDFGHLNGDQIIKLVGKYLTEEFNTIPAYKLWDKEYKSYTSHWGWDEFAWIFVWLSESEAQRHVKNVTDRLKNTLFRDKNGDSTEYLDINITLSTGLAHNENKQWEESTFNSWSNMLQTADAYMYLAKEQAKEDSISHLEGEWEDIEMLIKKYKENLLKHAKKYEIDINSFDIESIEGLKKLNDKIKEQIENWRLKSAQKTANKKNDKKNTKVRVYPDLEILEFS